MNRSLFTPKRPNLGLGLVLGAALLALNAHAADAATPAAARTELLQSLTSTLQTHYVFPEALPRLGAALKQRVRAYPADLPAQALAQRLSQDLRELSGDKHFMVMHDPDFRADENPDALPSAEDIARQQEQAGRLGYGLPTVQRLPGNVAYVELRGFGPTEAVAPAYSAVLSLLQGSEALILDLRRNGGGSPDSVALWMSHFFPKGDPRHLNDIYTRRTGKTQQFWTQPSASPRYDKPVYVLTAPRTFSAGEDCAYAFQTQKRATLIGQTTGGGANPVDRFSLGQGLVAAVPVARSINPITQTNWEAVGVKPDVEVPAAQALQAAHLSALRALLVQAKDPGRTQHLQRLIAMVEKGETETPVYELRQ